jgi:hypothetical protein
MADTTAVTTVTRGIRLLILCVFRRFFREIIRVIF